MESSTVVAFRALVLVACLIVVPLAAIFGSQFPDVVKSVLIDRVFPNGIPGIASSAEPPRDAAPPFDAAPEATAWQAAPNNAAPTATPPAGQAANGSAPGWPGAGVEPAVAWNPPGQVRPAAGESPPGAQPGGAERLGVSLPQDGRQNAPAYPNQNQAVAAASPYGAPQAPTAHLVPPPDRFTLMERRLREFGATYYLLERGGTDSETFRFHCKMAIANNPTHTRTFEVTDSDPLRAMSRVVEQVEAWRAGRLP